MTVRSVLIWKSHRSFEISFSRTVSGVQLYHFNVSFTPIKLNCFTSSEWIIFAIELCIFTYDVAAKFVQPDKTCKIVSGMVLHIIQVSLSVVLWMCFFIYLVVTACSCIATIVASVPPFSPAPFIQSRVLVYVALFYHLMELTVKWLCSQLFFQVAYYHYNY